MLSPREVTRHEKNKCAAGDRNIGTSVVCSAGAASTVLARRIRLQVGCGRHQVAANLFPDRVGHNTVCLCVESAPDCQNAVFAGGVTIISLFFDSMAAYAFARMKFTGRKLLFGIILLTMMIPFQVVMIPLYMEEYKLGILNTFLGLILPRAASAYGIFMLTSFFSGIPKSLDEAAKIDGMGEWKIYLKIILPLAKPALVTLGIYHFMNNWNDLLYPMMLTSSVEMRTLSAGLAILVGSNSIKYGPTLAATVIAILPLLLLFLFGQKFFMEGIATSGMKE